MLVADTSTLVAYLEGRPGRDVDVLDEALENRILNLVPPVLAEFLSDPELPPPVRVEVLHLPVLPLLEGYWERVGALRARLFARGRRAKLADSLIAQACLDHDAELITRDRDFGAFKRYAGLRLVL
jgi:predicted nucleic acid-binding protein